ncbi:Flp family type IVb pilin [Pseudomonas nicosulfuronedens]
MKDLSLKLYCKAKAFAADKEGATAIEYAVIAGLIAIAIVGTAKVLGTDISAVFTKVSTQIK